MALEIGTLLETADRMLRTDAFSSAAKNGGAKTAADRSMLSRAEQEQFARYSMTYASADQVRDQRGEAGAKKSAPAALVYHTARNNLRESVGDVDPNADVTLEWLDELAHESGDTGGLMHLAAASSPKDPISFEARLESLRTYFNDNDIDMGGGVWVRTGRIPDGVSTRDHVKALLRDFIREREESYGESFHASEPKTTPIAGVTTGIRAAGKSIAQDGFGEQGTESTLIHATQIASLIKRMGSRVKHTSAKARVVGEQLQGDTPVHAEVHMFFRPDRSYVTFSAIGGQASRAWEE